MNTKLAVGLASLAIMATLAACLPRAATLPSAADVQTATPELPIDGAAPEPEGTTEPTPESSELFALSKPEIRDRMYDWEYMVTPAFDAFDAATTPSTMRAAAVEILRISKGQEQWFVKHTDYDPRYKVPISLWRDAVGLMTSGATSIVRGVDRGDQPLIRKGSGELKAGRDAVSSDAFLGEWGPLFIH